jgi:phosphoglycerate dehydrogenase-like enzyme
MEVHACLWNDVSAFNFLPEHLRRIQTTFPSVTLHCHRDEASFLSRCASADVILTWEFPQDWYAKCPELKTIITPAAGNDWIATAREDRVRVIHGRFHGRILAESLLSAMLFMNHRMPAMIRNFQAKTWDRNLQSGSRLLGNQQVLIIGMGSIGETCARLIAATGATVTGIRRQPEQSASDLAVHGLDALVDLLPLADHVILLMPGDETTDGFMSPERLRLCKQGAVIYNFGRGNSLTTEALLPCLDHLGGAFLDVTDEEPLPPTSPLWEMENVMITPHSSCVYEEYRGCFIEEVLSYLEKVDRS